MWPSTELKYNMKLTIVAQEGIHALHSQDGGPLFLVKFTPVPPFGHATSILCIDPHATAEAECKFRCHLSSSSIDIGWQKSSDFQVRSTNLSKGFPAPEDGGYSFVAPNTTSITVSIAKIMRDKRGNEIRLKRLQQSILPYAIAS
jgi:E3 ubiquitin-protein ligase SIAH1